MKRSAFLNFIFACIPGVGFMYNGLIKKGISIFIIFILGIQVPEILYMGFLTPIVVLPIWFYSFFKTFDIYKRINEGEYIEDNVVIGQETLETIIIDKKYKKYIGIALIVLGTFALARSVMNDFSIFRFWDYRFRSYVGPSAFIILGIYILFKSNPKNVENSSSQSTEQPHEN